MREAFYADDRYTIRLAAPEERSRCMQIENQVWATFHAYAEGTDWVEYDPALHVVCVAADGEIIATGDACPLDWDGDPASLPAGGWIEIIRAAKARQAQPSGARLPYASALGISVLPQARGLGVGRRMIEALRSAAAAAGYEALVAPVRPSEQWRMPQLTIGEYAEMRLPSGEHFDPWLRLHERAGGEIVGVCPRSLTMRGSREQWEEWTHLRLPVNGKLLVEMGNGYLVLEDGAGTMHEDSVWVLHRCAPAA